MLVNSYGSQNSGMNWCKVSKASHCGRLESSLVVFTVMKNRAPDGCKMSLEGRMKVTIKSDQNDPKLIYEL